MFDGVCVPLSQWLHALGGEIADSNQKVTHLVATKVTRTVKFLAAMSVVKHIVKPDWLEESWRSQRFVGRCLFFLPVSKLGCSEVGVIGRHDEQQTECEMNLWQMSRLTRCGMQKQRRCLPSVWKNH